MAKWLNKLNNPEMKTPENVDLALTLKDEISKVMLVQTNT